MIQQTPQNIHTLKVIRVARTSTLKGDESGLGDQLAILKAKVEEFYRGPVEYTDVATQGSGGNLEREELKQLKEMIESEEYDIVVTEDLTRICRRTCAVEICKLCVDSGTRLIAFNDRVDTGEEVSKTTYEGA